MDARPLTRWAGATCLVVAPLSFTLVQFFSTYGPDDPVGQQLADVAANPGAMSASNLLGLPNLLIVPALVFVAMLARRGSPRLSLIGGGISILAWLAGMVAFGGQNIAYEAAAGVPDRTGAVAVMEAVNANPTFTALVLTFVLGHLVGMVVLGIGVWRSRVAPAWVGLGVALVPVLNVAAQFVGPVAAAVPWALLLVTLGYLAAVLVRMPDDDWDLTPVTLATRVPSQV